MKQIKRQTEVQIQGVKSVFYKMEGVRSILLRCIVFAGSAYEPTINWGAFHLLEHMTFQGTKGFSDKHKIELFKEEYSITSNAWTGGRELGFWFEFPDTQVDAGLKIFEEIVFNATIPEHELKREASVIRQEYVDKWSNPYARFSRASDKFLFGEDHQFVRDGVGQPDFVDAISQKKLKTLYRKYVKPENMVISVVGNFDQKTIEQKLTKLLNQYKGGKKVNLVILPIKPSKKYYLNHNEDVDLVDINYHWILPGKEKLPIAERLKFHLISYLLGGSARSALFKKLREELGLVYKTGTRQWFNPVASFFDVWASASPKNAQKVHEVISALILDFMKKKVSVMNFDRAKRFINMQILMSYDSVGGIADKLSNQLFYENRIITPEEYEKILAPVTYSQAIGLFKSLIEAQKSRISVLSRDKITLK